MIRKAGIALIFLTVLSGCASTKLTVAELSTRSAFALAALRECRSFLETGQYSRDNLIRTGYKGNRWATNQYSASFGPKIQKLLMKVDQEYDVALIHTLFGKEPICHISSNVETTSTAIYMILSFKEAGYNVELSGRGHYLITKNGKGFTASLVFDQNSGRHNLKVN